MVNYKKIVLLLSSITFFNQVILTAEQETDSTSRQKISGSREEGYLELQESVNALEQSTLESAKMMQELISKANETFKKENSFTMRFDEYVTELRESTQRSKIETSINAATEQQNTDMPSTCDAQVSSAEAAKKKEQKDKEKINLTSHDLSLLTEKIRRNPHCKKLQQQYDYLLEQLREAVHGRLSNSSEPETEDVRQEKAKQEQLLQAVLRYHHLIKKAEEEATTQKLLEQAAALSELSRTRFTDLETKYLDLEALNTKLTQQISDLTYTISLKSKVTGNQSVEKEVLPTSIQKQNDAQEKEQQIKLLEEEKHTQEEAISILHQEINDRERIISKLMIEAKEAQNTRKQFFIEKWRYAVLHNRLYRLQEHAAQKALEIEKTANHQQQLKKHYKMKLDRPLTRFADTVHDTAHATYNLAKEHKGKVLFGAGLVAYATLWHYDRAPLQKLITQSATAYISPVLSPYTQSATSFVTNNLMTTLKAKYTIASASAYGVFSGATKFLKENGSAAFNTLFPKQF